MLKGLTVSNNKHLRLVVIDVVPEWMLTLFESVSIPVIY